MPEHRSLSETLEEMFKTHTVVERDILNRAADRIDHLETTVKELEAKCLAAEEALARSTERTIELLETSLQTREGLSSAKRMLDFARNYNGLAAAPCPLCNYNEGILLEACGYHKEIERLQEQIKGLMYYMDSLQRLLTIHRD